MKNKKAPQLTIPEKDVSTPSINTDSAIKNK